MYITAILLPYKMAVSMRKIVYGPHPHRHMVNKDEKESGENKTVTQGGTQTRDLANGLPCSNQHDTITDRSQVANG